MRHTGQYIHSACKWSVTGLRRVRGLLAQLKPVAPRMVLCLAIIWRETDLTGFNNPQRVGRAFSLHFPVCVVPKL